ncbi:MAG: hypothetical protein LBT30_02070 [Clostridiales bacterium]|jgi:hypothetical protein|nr:hypothetical protein [Clostridiales bacterium]
MKQNELKEKRDKIICSVWAIVGQYPLHDLKDKAVEICLQYFPQADEFFLQQIKYVAHFAQEYYHSLKDFDSGLDRYTKRCCR